MFFETFSTVEECYRAAFAQGVDRLSRTLAGATAREVAWLERVRSGLVAMLGFFDDEPDWARLLLLETSLSVTVTVGYRQQLHDLLGVLLEREGDVSPGHGGGRAAGSPVFPASLQCELIVGGVFSLIRTSVLEHDARRLVELAPSLMAFIVAPYLGQAVAQAELEGRPSHVSAIDPGLARAQAISRAAALPVRATHRTTQVLRAIARTPYSNNREIAHAAGIADEGQASKLLARLERRGVIENVGAGPARGEPNAWLLTAAGRHTVEVIGQSTVSSSPNASSARLGGAR